MSFRRLIGKLSLLVVMLLVLTSGLTIFGCRGELGAIARGWSGVAIADGALFLGSMDGKLIAINESNQDRLWPDVPFKAREQSGGFGCARTPGAVAIYGTPAVTGDLVYIAGYIIIRPA